MTRKLLISACLLALVACDDATVPSPPTIGAKNAPANETADPAPQSTPATVELPAIGPKAQTKRKTEIDWASARSDLVANSDDTVQIQSAGEEPADVPVLLPTGIVISQSAGTGPVFRRTSDGYFAFYPGDKYNITVNGTNEVVEADAIQKNNPEHLPTFSTTLAGAEVWLSKYGANYIVEFECNAIASEEVACIEEQEAMEIANNLIVSGSR